MSRLTTDQNHWPVTTISLPIVQQCAHVAELKRQLSRLIALELWIDTLSSTWQLVPQNLICARPYLGKYLKYSLQKQLRWLATWSHLTDYDQWKTLFEDTFVSHYNLLFRIKFMLWCWLVLMAYFALVLNLTVINSGLHFQLLYKRRLETFCLDNPSHRLWLVSDPISPKGKCLSYDNFLPGINSVISPI